MTRLPAHERRAQILQVAAELFAERGYHGTTTAALAEAAGVTEPILYRHFDDKRHLFIELVGAIADTVIAQWRSRLDDSMSRRDRLEALLTRNPATHERGEAIYRVLFHAMTESGDDELTAALRRHISSLHEFVQEVTGSAGAAWLLVDVAIGVGMVVPLQSEPDRRAHVEAVTAILRSAVAPG